MAVIAQLDKLHPMQSCLRCYAGHPHACYYGTEDGVRLLPGIVSPILMQRFWLELMFPECTTVFSLESLLWVSALIMFLLLSPQTLQWVSREYSDTGGSDFSASEAAYGRLTLGSPAGMSTRIYVCLQWWKLLLFFFFSFLSKSSLLSHPSTRKYPKRKGRASLQRGLPVWRRRSGVTLETSLTEHSVARTSRCSIVVIGRTKTKKNSKCCFWQRVQRAQSCRHCCRN